MKDIEEIKKKHPDINQISARIWLLGVWRSRKWLQWQA